MRIVIDTNIIISALFFNGKNTQNLIELVNSNPDLFAVANNEILIEYERKITKYKKTDVIPKDREESYSIFYSNLIVGEKKAQLIYAVTKMITNLSNVPSIINAFTLFQGIMTFYHLEKSMISKL